MIHLVRRQSTCNYNSGQWSAVGLFKFKGKFKCYVSAPTLEDTVFGCIVSDHKNKAPINWRMANLRTACNISILDIYKNIQKFWTTEECPGERQFLDKWHILWRTIQDRNAKIWRWKLLYIYSAEEIPENEMINSSLISFSWETNSYYNRNLHLSAGVMRVYETLVHTKDISSEEAEPSKSYCYQNI